MTNSYQAVSIANMVLFGFGMAGVLIIVWIGWLRTRRLGYLILAAWALTVMAGMATSYLPLVQSLLGKPGGQQSNFEIMAWINLLRTMISFTLLLVGLGLLVFGKPRGFSTVT